MVFDKLVFWLKCHKLATFAGLAKFAAPVVLRLHNLKPALFGTQRSNEKNKTPGNDLVCLVLQSAGELWRFLLYSLFIVAIATRVLVGIWAAFQIGAGCCCGRTACGFGYLGVKFWPRCRSMFEKTTRALTPPICGSRPAIFPAEVMEGCLMQRCWRFTMGANIRLSSPSKHASKHVAPSPFRSTLSLYRSFTLREFCEKRMTLEVRSPKCRGEFHNFH